MSKKKIIILIIILIIVVGLVWFFSPKKNYHGNIGSGSTWQMCKCFGVKATEQIRDDICYGFVYCKKIKETKEDFFSKNFLNERNGIRSIDGSKHYFTDGENIAYCTVLVTGVCWLLPEADIDTFKFSGSYFDNYMSDYAKDKNNYYKDKNIISKDKVPQF